jgi:putative ABC transport system ATP-binding protein
MTASRGIEVESVSHTYERWGHRADALTGLNLTVPAGEWVTLVGPNGSGKSTLLQLLGGWLTPQTGGIRVGGLDVRSCSRRSLAQVMFWVHQNPMAGTAPTLTVEEHLLLARSPDTAAPRASARSLLDGFGLDVALHQPAQTLSGGQRQLLVLLMAKLRRVPVVLLDEPFAAVDSQRAELCTSVLKSLHEDGTTLLFVTHDLDYAIAHGTRTVGLLGVAVATDCRGSKRTRSELLSLWQLAAHGANASLLSRAR